MHVGVVVFLLAANTVAFASDATKIIGHSDWTSIRAAHEQAQRAVMATPTGARAMHRGQQWIADFDQRGFIVRPSSASGGGWEWGLELEGGTAATPRIEENSVRFTRSSGIEEWFHNTADGLEQGFTVRTRPPGSQGPLTFNLNVRGTLAALGSGESIQFVSSTGTAVVNYGGLKAWDATGRPIAAHMEGRGRRVVIEVDDAGARYPVTVDPIAQQAYIKASNTDAYDNFGYSIAMSGDTVVVGAPGEDSSAVTVNPGAAGEANNDAADVGAAYVFVRLFGAWRQQAYLKAFRHGLFDIFGTSVAISGDTIAVGAIGENVRAGSVYVFVRNAAGIWTQQSYLKAPYQDALDEFGTSVSLSGDTLVVGAPGEGSDATVVNGDQANNRAPGAGAAYVFARASGVWTQQAYLKASNAQAYDGFGVSVAISADTIVAGARHEASAATGINGNQLDNSANDAGAAYVFVRQGAVWSQQAYLKASNADPRDQFGHAVAISGDSIAVGARCEGSAYPGVNGNQSDNSAFAAGAVYIFVRSGTSWAQQAYIKASVPGADDQFGFHLSLSGNTLVVGAPQEKSNAKGVDGNQLDNSLTEAGAVYVFSRAGDLWTQQSYLKASNTTADDRFGQAVSVSGDTIAVGADHEDSNATGLSGNQADTSATDAGAAYIFTIPPDQPKTTLSFSATEVLAGSPVTMTITLTNPNPGTLAPVSFVDTFPAGLMVSSPSALASTCSGTVVATPGTAKLTLSDGALNPGDCTITVNVMSVAPGAYTNSLQVISPAGPSNTAHATLAISSPPNLSKSFAYPQVPPNTPVAMTISLTNTNSLALSPVAFVETLPDNLLIATPSGLVSTCGGTAAAVPGSNTLSLTSGTIKPGTCTISVNVTSSQLGTYTASMAVISPAGWSNVASAALTVAAGSPQPPGLKASFSTKQIAFGGIAIFALAVTNPSSSLPISGLVLNTVLPDGLAVATPNALSNTCGGTVTAASGSHSIVLANGSIAPAAACLISVNVQALLPGSQISLSSPVSSGTAAANTNTVQAETFVLHPPSTYQVRYMSNLLIGDSTVSLTNSGASSIGTPTPDDGNLCVSVFTYSAEEQLVSCCSCVVTPNGLNSLSARNDLIASLTPSIPTSVVVKLLASAPAASGCNAATVTYDALRPGLVAWGSTLHALPIAAGTPATTYGVTSRPFVKAELSQAELSRMTQLCGFIQANGSGYGICKSCRVGGL